MTVSKVSSCRAVGLHRSLYKGKLKSYLVIFKTAYRVSGLWFPVSNLPKNCFIVVEFVG